MPNEDIRATVTNDCADVWSKATIRKFMPDDYKDPKKQAAGKKRQENRLEEPIPVGTVPTENSPDSQTEQESERFEDMDKGPDVKHTHKVINQLKSELKNVRETYEARLKEEEEKEKLSYVENPDNLEKIPEIIDDKIGPVKIQNLSKISQFDRRGYQILAGRFAELIRRKLAAEGRASIKFYVIGKDRTTNVESLVPVSFIVDLKERTTDMTLDESRLWLTNI